MRQMYAYGQRYSVEGKVMQHMVLVCPWHGGVRPGLLPSGSHVSCDGVQVDMLFIDLSNAGECGRARKPLRLKGDNFHPLPRIVTL